jgi:hypothetical protein
MTSSIVNQTAHKLVELLNANSTASSKSTQDSRKKESVLSNLNSPGSLINSEGELFDLLSVADGIIARGRARINVDWISQASEAEKVASELSPDELLKAVSSFSKLVESLQGSLGTSERI